jgi:hypothetical protein
MKLKFCLLIGAISVALFALSCKNRNVTEDVQKYCECLNQYKTDALNREQCIELMNEIKAKYADDNRALMQILEETDNCR